MTPGWIAVWGWRGGERPMGTTIYGGKGFKEKTRLSGERPIAVVPLLSLSGLSLPPYTSFLSLGRLCQQSPQTVPVPLLCVGSTQRRATALAIDQGCPGRHPIPAVGGGMGGGGGGGGRNHDSQLQHFERCQWGMHTFSLIWLTKDNVGHGSDISWLLRCK